MTALYSPYSMCLSSKRIAMYLSDYIHDYVYGCKVMSRWFRNCRWLRALLMLYRLFFWPCTCCGLSSRNFERCSCFSTWFLWVCTVGRHVSLSSNHSSRCSLVAKNTALNVSFFKVNVIWFILCIQQASLKYRPVQYCFIGARELHDKLSTRQAYKVTSSI